MRIFLDANILFSAARADGAMRRLIELSLAGGHTLVADRYVVEEARRNLLLKSTGGVASLETLLQRVALVPIAPPRLLPKDAEALPEKDRPVIAAARRGHCDMLVTGDRSHFGAFYGQRLAGVLVLSPAMLAERLLAHPGEG